MLVSGSVHLRFMGFPLIPLVRLEDFWCQILEMSFMHPKHVSNMGLAANVKNDQQGKFSKKKGLFSWFNIRRTPDITYIAVSVIYLMRWVVEASNDIVSLNRVGTNKTKTRWAVKKNLVGWVI